MSCKICGRGACASWMHRPEEQDEWESVEHMDDRQCKEEIIYLRREIKDLNEKIEKMDKIIESLQP